MKSRLYVLGILICMLFMSLPVQAFAESSSGVIHIKTVKDLKSFAKSCRSDEWSKGKVVVLDNDLTIEKEELVIASFSGIFDGQGHTIYDIRVSEAASNTGFFGQILTTGTVSNLSITGKYKPEKILSRIGGIAGSNYGTIENCTYKGRIRADSEVGGIVGRNMSTGVVKSCRFSGSIEGDSMCGGIVGYNEGTVTGCSNDGSVNTSYEDTTITNDELTDALETIIMGEKVRDFRDFQTRIDVGGICGFNEGSVFLSVNRGNVGYKHVGYNIGGVVGRSTGFVRGCSNRNIVYGRKDIGGVVGQQQPYLVLDFDQGDLGELHSQVKTLGDLVNGALNDTSGYSADTTERLLGISEQTDAAVNDIDNLADDLSEGGQELSDIASDTVKVGRLMVDDAADYIENVQDALDEFEEQLELKEDQLSASGQELRGLNNAITNARNSLSSTQDVLIDFERLPLEDMTVTVPDFRNIVNSYRSAVDKAQEVMESVAAITDGDLQGAGRDLKDAMRDEPGFYDDAMELLNNADAFNDRSSDLNNDVRKSGTDLYATIGEITDNIDDTVRSVNGDIQGAISSLHDIQRQSDRISDKINDMLEKAADPDTYFEDKTRDVSDEDIDQATDGRTSECKNLGDVDGDYNVGGITGTMAYELDMDPDSDIEENGKSSFDYVLLTKCIIDKSQNEGRIHSNRYVSGGITGRMELGLVKGCANFSDVTSDGDYVGGIAGYSSSQIDTSYAKQYISGKRYVGGVVGYGKKISGCASMTNKGKADQYLGAIAGNVEDINNTDISNNKYYAKDIYGIDGVSYRGMAEGCSYKSLLAIPGIPDEFSTLSVTFMDDEDEVVGTVECRYGESIDESQIPEVPEREGFFGRWKRSDFSKVVSDEVVRCKYERIVSLIRSNLTREDDHPILLAEGQFGKGDKLVLEELDSSEGADNGKWKVTVPDDGQDSHTFRYRPSDSHHQTSIKLIKTDENGSEYVKSVSTGKMGEYVTFEADGNEFVFSADEYWEGTKGAVALLVLLALAGGAVVFVIRFKKGKVLAQRLIRWIRQKMKDSGQSTGSE